jgi:F-type H+-transporting ATPase subunit b
MPFAAAKALAQTSQGESLAPLMQKVDHEILEAAGIGHSAGGLPQFDPTWFASQVFWLLVMFSVLYAVFARRSLPALSSIIENRKNHIQADLELAEKLTSEAEVTQAAYEKSLSGARNQSTQMLGDIHASMQTTKNEQSEAFRQKSEAAIHAAEQRLTEAKNKALSEISDIVADVAAQAVEKIIGRPADAGQARSIVSRLSDDKKAA